MSTNTVQKNIVQQYEQYIVDEGDPITGQEIIFPIENHRATCNEPLIDVLVGNVHPPHTHHPRRITPTHKQPTRNTLYNRTQHK